MNCNTVMFFLWLIEWLNMEAPSLSKAFTTITPKLLISQTQCRYFGACLDVHYFDIASGHSSAAKPAAIQTLWFMWACSDEGLRPFYNVLLYMLPTGSTSLCAVLLVREEILRKNNFFSEIKWNKCNSVNQCSIIYNVKYIIQYNTSFSFFFNMTCQEILHVRPLKTVIFANDLLCWMRLSCSF